MTQNTFPCNFSLNVKLPPKPLSEGPFITYQVQNGHQITINLI